MNEFNVRLRYIGRIHELPPEVQERMAWATSRRRKTPALIMTLALNYGARAELIDAFLLCCVFLTRTTSLSACTQFNVRLPVVAPVAAWMPSRKHDCGG